MKLDALFLADTAEVVSDTLTVRGGLWDGLIASSFPASHVLVVVLLLRPDLDDVGEVQHLDLHVRGPGGTTVGGEHVDVTLHTYRRQLPVVVRVPATFTAAGTYAVRVVSQVGTDMLSFDVTPSTGSRVATAVEGYALGVKR